MTARTIGDLFDDAPTPPAAGSAFLNRPETASPRRWSRRDVIGRGLYGAVGLAAGAALTACGSAASSAPATATGKAGPPKRGGNLRVAIVGGSPADSLDADNSLFVAEALRNFALYNGLVALDASGETITPDLADEITPNRDASQWTIRVKPGILFHNGKELTADDVIFTFRRIISPKSTLDGLALFSTFGLHGMRALDRYTARLSFKSPFATFIEQIAANYDFGIVPVGYNPRKPVGTGPFRYESFTPGQQSVFVKNPDYFKHGLPYLDALTVIDSFADPTSAINALYSKAVDVFGSAPPVLAKQAERSGGLKAVSSAPGLWTPFTMRVDVPPFSDVRVRQAFRLIVGRSQMINTTIDGFGVVANDVFGSHDPCYDRTLRRQQDLPQARFLLKQAGREGLTVELVTAPMAAGTVEAATVFKQQALGAGVTVNVRQLTLSEYFGPNYLKWDFAQDFWQIYPFFSQVFQSTLPTSPYNETHFNNPRYNDLYRQANSTVDASLRCQLSREMQRIQFDEGGYIIPSFNEVVDLMASNVNGVGRAGTGVPVGNGNFEHIWLA